MEPQPSRATESPPPDFLGQLMALLQQNQAHARAQAERATEAATGDLTIGATGLDDDLRDLFNAAGGQLGLQTMALSIQLVRLGRRIVELLEAAAPAQSAGPAPTPAAPPGPAVSAETPATPAN